MPCDVFGYFHRVPCVCRDLVAPRRWFHVFGRRWRRARLYRVAPVQDRLSTTVVALFNFAKETDESRDGTVTADLVDTAVAPPPGRYCCSFLFFFLHLYRLFHHFPRRFDRRDIAPFFCVHLYLTAGSGELFFFACGFTICETAFSMPFLLQKDDGGGGDKRFLFPRFFRVSDRIRDNDRKRRRAPAPSDENTCGGGCNVVDWLGMSRIPAGFHPPGELRRY